MKIEENVPLARLTTFKIGGPARYLVTVPYRGGVPDAVAFANEKRLPLVPLGSGSNMLAPDKGVEAVFVRYSVSAKSDPATRGTDVEMFVGAGCLWDDVVAFAVGRGYWGAENLSAIPGTVGASVVQNIGAYGAALEEIAFSVEAFDTKDGVFREFSNRDCRFGYRTSIFKEQRDRYIITLVTLRFSTAPQPRLSYRDIAEHFTKTGEEPTLPNIRNAVIAIRARKFPPLATHGTAGSFFLNPVVSADEAHAMQARFPGIPLFPMPEGGTKVPLAWILDRVLALKGLRSGGAFLWEAQPLVIATDEKAIAGDVIALADAVCEKVKMQTGIEISPEVRILA